MMKLILYSSFLVLFFYCKSKEVGTIKISDVAELADGWQGVVIGSSTESYVGWDVEIGDADNDGHNEVLTTGCTNSSLNMYELEDGKWKNILLAENLAKTFPGMGLAVKIVDLDKDGSNEIILGTGQEEVGTTIYYTFRLEDSKLNTLNVSRPDFNKSGWTHNLAPYDLDGDGMIEVISAYCGHGEIIRYDYADGLEEVRASKIHQLSGSGEESLIADVDNDGHVEYITSNSFRKEDAKIEIYEFDEAGELILPPRLVIDNYDGKRCFYASVMVGDLDNDGKNEMVIGWKQDQNINVGTLLGYRVGEEVMKKYTFAYEDKDLDLSYFEKMMLIDDADNDGLNELLVSTRGDNLSEFIDSEHLGHVFMWTISKNEIRKELLLNFHEGVASSSWIAVGDADNDGLNEIILATGEGDRTKKGTSYVLMVEKSDSD
jgi:hypothetical protein